MSLVAIPGFVTYPRIPQGVDAGVPAGSRLLDAAGEGCGMIFRVPRTGNIRTIGYSTKTVTTGATLDVRVETVDLATGQPSGTLWGTNTNGASVVASSDDNVWKSVTLTADAAVTQGDLLAVVIVAPSGFSGNIGDIPLDNDLIGPYAVYNSGAGWGKVANAPQMAIAYDDGVYADITNLWPIVNATSTTTFSTTGLVGSKINIPFPCKVSGIWTVSDLDGADTIWRIYDVSGTQLATASHDKDVQLGSTSRLHIIRFSSDITLSANTDYYVMAGSVGSNASSIRYFNVANTDIMNAWGNADTHYVSTTTQSPTSSDWTPNTTRKAFIGVLITALDDGSGSGGGTTAHVF